MFLHTNEINQIKERINGFVKQGRPFFFILNYELSEGVFVDNPLDQSHVFFTFTGQGNKPKKMLTDFQNRLKAFPQCIDN